MATGNTSRQLYAMELCATKGLVSVPGSFRVESTGPAVDDARGDGFSVEINTGSAGEYVVTFAEKYPGMVSATFGVEEPTDGTAAYDLVVTSETYDASAGTVLLRLAAADGTPAPADIDNVRINFNFCLQKYSALVVTHD